VTRGQGGAPERGARWLRQRRLPMAGVAVGLSLASALIRNVGLPSPASAEVEGTITARGLNVNAPRRLSAVLEPRISLPRRVEMQEPFNVRIEFAIASIDGGDVKDARPGALEDLREYLTTYASASLAIAGMSVRPQEPVSLASGLAASWSVEASAPGRFTGVLQTTVGRTQSPEDGGFLLVPPQELPVTVSIGDGAGAAVQYVGTAAGVLGVAAALAALLGQWLDRGRKLPGS
jgi:hypothetical protein